MAVDDRRAIAALLIDLATVLDGLVSDGERFREPFDLQPRFRSLAFTVNRWSAARERGAIYTLVPAWLRPMAQVAWSEVSRLLPGAISELSVNDEEASALDLRLEMAGLTGVQLQMKLAGFYRATELVTEESMTTWPVSVPQAPVDIGRWRFMIESVVGRWTLALRAMFRDILRFADVLLGSLVGVLPVLEPIKELKEELELSLESAEP